MVSRRLSRLIIHAVFRSSISVKNSLLFHRPILQLIGPADLLSIAKKLMTFYAVIRIHLVYKLDADRHDIHIEIIAELRSSSLPIAIPFGGRRSSK